MAETSPIMVGPTPAALAALPAPFDMTWGMSDVSAADAGRSNDANATMYKNVITRKVTLGLTWKNLNGEQTAQVLRAFLPEYVYVRYHEPTLNAYVVKEFYTGDKSAPVHSIDLRSLHIVYKTVSFNVIER